jgi:hypothetical protein
MGVQRRVTVLGIAVPNRIKRNKSMTIMVPPVRGLRENPYSFPIYPC